MGAIPMLCNYYTKLLTLYIIKCHHFSRNVLEKLFRATAHSIYIYLCINITKIGCTYKKNITNIKKASVSALINPATVQHKN